MAVRVVAVVAVVAVAVATGTVTAAHTSDECASVRAEVAARRLVLDAATEAGGLTSAQATQVTRERAILNRALVHCPTPTTSSTTVAPTTTTTAQPAPTGSQGGVYLGAPASWDRPPIDQRVATYETWLGGPVDLVLDFEAADTWDNVAGAGWQLGPWSQIDRRLILTVPMLAGGWWRDGPTSGSGAGVPVSLAQCGAGAYDHHWRDLAADLVAYGLADSILRVGHEFNGGWYTWRAAEDPAGFVACFRRVATVMRSQAGQAFEFVWNPIAGWQQFPATDAWPGADVVDYVGVDSYDESWPAEADPVARWRDYTYGGSYALAFWSQFARDQGVPLAIPEWGVQIRPDWSKGMTWEELYANPLAYSDGHGGGDNPYYVEQMHRFINDPVNNVAFAVYFEFDASDGLHSLTRPGSPFVESADTYQRLW